MSGLEGSVVREGKTVQEAIEKGLRSLSIKREQADIEVLSEGKKGFFGIGSRKAKVRVSIKEEVVAELKLMDVLVDLNISDSTGKVDKLPPSRAENMDGDTTINRAEELENERPCLSDTAACLEEEPEIVRQPGTAGVIDGRLVINKPVNDTTYPSLRPGKAVKLIVNGDEVSEQIVVGENDDVQVQLVDEEPVSSLELDVSPDGLEARLTWFRQPGARYRLIDQEPAESLMLITEVSEIVDPPDLSVDDLKRFLRDNNVIRGVIDEALEQVLENPNSKESFIVARGLEPVDGIDAYIVYPFMEKAQEQEEESLFGRDKLISVEAGEVVAIKIPREAGTDGWKVSGEVIPAKLPAECEIHVKNGCEIIENGHKAVSTISGRPIIETVSNKAYVKIDPVYVAKEVNQTTGDIKFYGDVEVKKEVRDGCTIVASGNIEVFGDVSRATLNAGGSIILHKMVFGSTVMAGGRAAVYSTIRPYVSEIYEMLKAMYSAAQKNKTTLGSPATDDDGPLIQSLIDTRYSGLPQLINKLSLKLSEMDYFVHEDVLRLTRLLKKSFCGLGPLRLGNIASLAELKAEVGDILSLIEGSLRKTDSVKVRYVQNCYLASSGDIIIEGQGCYISTIDAGGNVTISGMPGIARGVKVVADGNIHIKDLGSDFETQTHVRIRENGKVTADMIRPDVLVQIGNERFRVDKTSRNFSAYLDSEEKIIIDRQVLEGKKE